jgi:methyl-accepting chemotaxis protein
MHSLTLLMRGFTIRLRMLGAIAMVVTLLLMVGGAGVFGMFRIQALAHDFGTHASAASSELASLRKHLGDLRRYEKDLIINYEKAEEIARYKQAWAGTLAHTRGSLDRLHTIAAGNDAVARIAGEIRAQVQAYQAAFEPVLAQIEASAYDSATAINRVAGKSKAAVHEAEKKLDALQLQLAADATQAQAAVDASVRFTLVGFGAALVLAMLLVVPLTLLNSHSIVKPISEACALAGRIAQGDLSGTVHAEGSDEAAQLLRALAAMQASLASVVDQVRQSAGSIQASSGEVASGNTDLSHRTEQAAGSLQQTASSMEQLTGTVRHSAESARQASALAAEAAQVAQRGGDVVAQVVSTMDEINTSSRRIADIVGTIDSIAFQTNILALNAAVEAARAGEQGRGFAVVASEVRALAQRSAGAAREIKSLIGTSVERVETGSRQVADAGSTMDEIVSGVQRVVAIINEISHAAGEQSSGIGQVNHAVSQLDRMTQQNAALVEQSAAAAESLKDQALRLTHVVGAFRLQQAGA